MAFVIGATPALSRDVPHVGTLRVVALRAAFPDRPVRRPAAEIAGTKDALLDRMVAYWSEVSHGRLRIEPDFVEAPVVVPRPRASYVQQPSVLAREAVHAYVEAGDPAEAATRRARLRQAHALIVFFAGTGRESHTDDADRSDPWSNYASFAPPIEGFDDAIVIAEEQVAPFSTFGVLCHEFGHQLGLPELYAPGRALHEGIGVWGLMGQGTWLKRGEAPPHLDAWSKARLGWVDVETITATRRRVVLPAVLDEPRVVKIPAGPGSALEYYLLEYRVRRGADAGLPGEGLLVWHVDESRMSFRGGQVDPARKLLHLVEADGRGDLDRGHAGGGNRGDATDPWQGIAAWRRWTSQAALLLTAIMFAGAIYRVGRPRPLVGVLVRVGLAAGLWLGAEALGRGPVCGIETPGMAPYGGTAPRVILRNLSPLGTTMTVDVLMADLPPA